MEPATAEESQHTTADAVSQQIDCDVRDEVHLMSVCSSPEANGRWLKHTYGRSVYGSHLTYRLLVLELSYRARVTGSVSDLHAESCRRSIVNRSSPLQWGFPIDTEPYLPIFHFDVAIDDERPPALGTPVRLGIGIIGHRHYRTRRTLPPDNHVDMALPA